MLLQEMKINKFVANYSSALLKKLEEENHQLQILSYGTWKKGQWNLSNFCPYKRESNWLIFFSSLELHIYFKMLKKWYFLSLRIDHTALSHFYFIAIEQFKLTFYITYLLLLLKKDRMYKEIKQDAQSCTSLQWVQTHTLKKIFTKTWLFGQIWCYLWYS